jgi:hypothetical protein
MKCVNERKTNGEEKKLSRNFLFFSPLVSYEVYWGLRCGDVKEGET